MIYQTRISDNGRGQRPRSSWFLLSIFGYLTAMIH